MTPRRLTAVSACLALLTPGLRLPSVSAQDQTVVIDHDAVNCMVANEYPRLDAALSPLDRVANARIYFKSNKSPFYYVMMEPRGGSLSGRLPRPRLDAGPITYYIEGFTTGGGSVQTEEFSSLVVRDAQECKTRVAPIAPGGPVTVFGASGAVPGFLGVISGAAPAAGVAAGGASTAAVVGTGAVFAGLTSALFLTPGNSSPSQ